MHSHTDNHLLWYSDLRLLWHVFHFKKINSKKKKQEFFNTNFCYQFVLDFDSLKLSQCQFLLKIHRYRTKGITITIKEEI